MVNLGAFMLAKPAGTDGAPPPPAGSPKRQLPPMSETPVPASSSTTGASPESPTRASSRTEGAVMPRYAARRSSTGPYNARNLSRTVPRHDVLDFSFLDLTDAAELCETEPRGGRVFQTKEQKAEQQRREALAEAARQRKLNAGKPSNNEGVNADGTAWDFGSAGNGVERTGDGYTVVRAGEETYAFKDEEELEKRRRVMTEDPDQLRYTLDADGNLVEKKGPKMTGPKPPAHRFHCTQLKLNNNGLTSEAVTQLPTVLMMLTIDPMRNLSVVDLSFNQLRHVPLLDGLPLHALSLHGNLIERMSEVAKLQVHSATLRKLTLNNNPVQEKTAKYKYAVLHTLPFLGSFDDSRVTAKDRERIAVFEELFVPAKNRGTTRKFLPPIAPSPGPQ